MQKLADFVGVFAVCIWLLCIRESSRYHANYEVANDKIGRVSWFSDFICQFSQATKPRPNFVDRLTCALQLFNV